MNIVQQMFGVFSDVGTWMIDSIKDITALFWDAETGLTFIGTLALVGLGIAVIRMIIAMIRSFMQLRH